MSSISVFSFEKQSVRTLGTSENPLFVAIDVARALGYSQPAKSVNDRVDPEDLIKAEVETKGGVQTLNCVNESGLYALIFGSKLESAKRFKKWVTSEVLPAIRRTGRYEAPTIEYITPEQGWQIQSAVQKRVHKDQVSFQTVYHALKTRFRVPKYSFILAKDFEAAIEFVRTCELRTPVVENAAPVPTKAEPTIPEGAVILTRQEANAFLSVAYQLKYLFRDPYRKFAAFLNAVGSPMSGQFFDAFNDMAVDLMAGALERNGMRIEDLDCYRYWAMKH